METATKIQLSIADSIRGKCREIYPELLVEIRFAHSIRFLLIKQWGYEMQVLHVPSWQMSYIYIYIYISIILKNLFKELADLCSLDFLFSFAFFSCSLILRPIILLCSRSFPLFAKHGRNSHRLPVYIATLSLSYKRYFFIIIFSPVLTFPALSLRKRVPPSFIP